MEKALANFFYYILISSAESHYGKSFVSIEFSSNSDKIFSWFLKLFIWIFNISIYILLKIQEVISFNWLIISIAYKDEVVTVALKEDFIP